MFFEEASESSRLIVLIHKVFNHIDFHIQTPPSKVISSSFGFMNHHVYSLDVLQTLGLKPNVCMCVC